MHLLPAGLPRPAVGAFTTRAGGTSAAPYDALNLGMHVQDEWRRVHANRELLAEAAGLDRGELVFAQQVHGAGVAVVDRASSRGRNGGVAGVDALVTTTPGLGLVVLAADCLPVLLADPAAGVVAVAHAGRQGLVAGVLQATLTAMAGLGATVVGTTAVIGPAACGRCYEVPPEMATEVDAAVPGSRSTTRSGTASVDLTRGAVAVLTGAGLSEVRTAGGCTLEQPELLYSYRRDGRTGRHAGIAWMSGG
ncbi:peptidoglycan editing factor PgeF [soil metagenome]